MEFTISPPHPRLAFSRSRSSHPPAGCRAHTPACPVPAFHHYAETFTARRFRAPAASTEHHLLCTIRPVSSGPVTLSAFAGLLAATFRRLDCAVNASRRYRKYSARPFIVAPCRTFHRAFDLSSPSTVRPICVFQAVIGKAAYAPGPYPRCYRRVKAGRECDKINRSWAPSSPEQNMA